MCKRENISFQEKICPAYDTSHRNSTDGSVVWGCTCPNHDKSRRISRYALFRPNFTVRFRAMFTVQGIRPDFTVRFRAMFTVQSLPARFHSAISGHVYSAEPSGQISQCDFGHVYSVGPTGANLYPSKRPCLSSAQSAPSLLWIHDSETTDFSHSTSKQNERPVEQPNFTTPPLFTKCKARVQSDFSPHQQFQKHIQHLRNKKQITDILDSGTTS